MTTDRPSTVLPVVAWCALGLAAAGVVVVDTDLERVEAPPRSVVLVQQLPTAPAPGLVRAAPAPRRVVVVRRRSRAS